MRCSAEKDGRVGSSRHSRTRPRWGRWGMSSFLGPQQGLSRPGDRNRKAPKCQGEEEDSWSEGNRSVPEEWQGGESSWRKVVDSHSHPARSRGSQGHPDLTTSDCGFPTPRAASGGLRASQECGQRTGGPPITRLVCGPCPASVSPFFLRCSQRSHREMVIGATAPSGSLLLLILLLAVSNIHLY